MMGEMLCSKAMKQFEPGTLDMYGAEWTSEAEYRMQHDAKRYEQYERNFAAVVRIFSFAASQFLQSPGRIVAYLKISELSPILFMKLAHS